MLPIDQHDQRFSERLDLLGRGESASGKCRRVAEATPSRLWQERQAAFSITG